MAYGRVEEWYDFAGYVEDHIENYAIEQYGDAPDDQVENWTADDCVQMIVRYCMRFQTNKRGRLETLRDLCKIAHYACLAFSKMTPTKDEIRKVRFGEK